MKGLAIKERDTFSPIVRAHQGAVRTFLLRLTRNDALADDLAQLTFIRAFNHRHKLLNQQSVKPWLFQIAYRIFLDDYRKEQRRKELTAEPEDSVQNSNSGLSMDINAAMNALSLDCRAAVMLNLAYGFSHDECAKTLEMPLGTVKSHVKRGKEKLKHFLKAYASVELKTCRYLIKTIPNS